MAGWRSWRPNQPDAWLQGFPDTIYDLSRTSRLTRIMEALCGDPGVGRSRKELMLRRAQTTLGETHFYDLDNVYSRLFDFPRLASETYDLMPDELVTWEQWDDAQVKDAHYRRRIRKYMEAFMWGGTRRGIELCVEAATDTPCESFDAGQFYGSALIAHGEPITTPIHDGVQVGVESPVEMNRNVSPDGLPICIYANEDESLGTTADYAECIAVVMRDEPLTSEEHLLAQRALSRLAPAHVRVFVMTRAELADRMAFDSAHEVEVPINGAQASSSWWNVVRHVTGRPDWEYKKYPHLWVKPNVEKEAPRQALVLSQEDVFDMTPLVTKASASSEHVGNYGRRLQSLFPGITSTDMPTEAMCAVSRASNRRYTASYYGGPDMVDWSYPVEYIPELDKRFGELSRSARWWSSEERKGSEWLEVELKRMVPIDRITMNVSRKPVRITPYYSSGHNADGARAWCRARSKDGIELAYSIRQWGGASIGSAFVTVEFETQQVHADAVRLEIERLDVPYGHMVGANPDTYEEERFDWSVEVSDLALGWDVVRRGDYEDSTFEDPFGNKVRTTIRECLPELALDRDSQTAWVSQPNVAPEAVEWLVLDVREGGKPSRVGFLDIEAVYEGAQMNVYSSDDCEAWTPYPEPYELVSGRIDLPDRMCSWLKLEFTNLTGIPYVVVKDGIMVRTLRYPKRETMHAMSLKTYSNATSPAGRLLMSPDDLSYDNATVYDVLGAPDIYSRTDSPLQTTYRNYANLFTSNQYRTMEQSSVRGAYGQDMARETTLGSVLPSVESADNNARYFRKMFHDVGRHKYEVDWFERRLDVAYVVGIRSIKVGHGGQNLKARPGDSFIAHMGEGGMVASRGGWDLVSDERMVPSTGDAFCNLVTQDLQSVMPFRSFDFATNQKEPDQLFFHPADMAKEWHGDAYPTEFGVSGTVLATDGPHRIVSDPKLMRMYGVARFEVEVFPQEWSTWTVEAHDLFGEQVLSMTYRCEGGRWNKLGVVFTPQPAAGWWDDSYSYRMRIPLEGPIEAGSHVFVPVVDFDAIAKADRCNANGRDVRLIWYDGTSNREVDCDVTDNMELWFRARQSLAEGQLADGSLDKASGEFRGAYYLYFGNPHPTDEPKRDWHEVFGEVEPYYSYVADDERGMGFRDFAHHIDFEGVRLSSAEGFISVEVTPDSDLVKVPDGTEGVPERRFILDYEDDDSMFGIQLYTYERQLTFVVHDANHYESSFVSEPVEGGVLAAGRRSLICCQWGAPGSDTSWRATSDTETAPDPELLNRRKITVCVDSPDPWECIPNVYDERRYIESHY